MPLFRQKALIELDDPNEKDPLELQAEKYNLNYIRLDGNVGAMVNGAGLQWRQWMSSRRQVQSRPIFWM